LKLVASVNGCCGKFKRRLRNGNNDAECRLTCNCNNTAGLANTTVQDAELTQVISVSKAFPVDVETPTSDIRIVQRYKRFLLSYLPPTSPCYKHPCIISIFITRLIDESRVSVVIIYAVSNSSKPFATDRLAFYSSYQ